LAHQLALRAEDFARRSSITAHAASRTPTACRRTARAAACASWTRRWRTCCAQRRFAVEIELQDEQGDLRLTSPTTGARGPRVNARGHGGFVNIARARGQLPGGRLRGRATRPTAGTTRVSVCWRAS
jgi:hypothetical protein